MKQLFPEDRTKPHFSLKEMWPIPPYKGPKAILYEMFHEIDLKSHFGYRRSWEILIELLAHHLGITVNPWLYSKPSMDIQYTEDKTNPMIRLGFRQNQGLYAPRLRMSWKQYPTQIAGETRQLLDRFEKTGLLEQYVLAARAEPWDHLGEIFVEQELAGRKNRLGQMLTPKQIVDFMIKCTLDFDKPTKEPRTVLDPCVGSGRFLIEASLMNPEKPLILFGIEIDVTLYRACLVNMALFSHHPYSIIRADTLMLELPFSMPGSVVWNLGNRWDPADLHEYYVKIPPPFKFSLADLAKARKEQPAEPQQVTVIPETPRAFSLAELVRAKKKQT
jgi:hypothetical protein